jgi:hypothetical protein
VCMNQPVPVRYRHVAAWAQCCQYVSVSCASVTWYSTSNVDAEQGLMGGFESLNVPVTEVLQQGA